MQYYGPRLSLGAATTEYNKQKILRDLVANNATRTQMTGCLGIQCFLSYKKTCDQKGVQSSVNKDVLAEHTKF